MTNDNHTEDLVIPMADNIHTEDPAEYCWLSSTSLRHNISIIFLDAQDRPIFDVDGGPSADPRDYRHRIFLRFSKVDSSIRVRETFSTVFQGRVFRGKVKSREEDAQVAATLMIPGMGFVVVRGEEERRPWPERARFVIQLRLKKVGVEEMVSFNRVGDTMRLDSKCGELDLMRHMRRLGEVKGLVVLVVLVENYRGNESFVGDEMREVLLPRFAVGGGRAEVRASEVMTEDWEMAEFERKAVFGVSAAENKRLLLRNAEKDGKNKVFLPALRDAAPGEAKTIDHGPRRVAIGANGAPALISVPGSGESATKRSGLLTRNAKNKGKDRLLPPGMRNAGSGNDKAILSAARGLATVEYGVPVRVRELRGQMGGSFGPRKRRARAQMAREAVVDGEMGEQKRLLEGQMAQKVGEKSTVEEKGRTVLKRPKRSAVAMRELAKRLVKGGGMPVRKPGPD